MIIAEKSELGESKQQPRFVEDTNDNALAVVGWNGGNAEIDRRFANFNLNSPVLWQAFFGNAHRAGHNLQPANNCGLQSFGRCLHFLQDPIDAKADAEFLVERFEMDVTGAKLVRFDDQH